MPERENVTLLRRLVPVAEEHGGLVPVAEAERAGVSNRMLLHYTSVGDLERVHRGVYRLVWLPHHRFADVIAACLRVGADAVAVDETAAAVWGLGDVMPAGITIGLPWPWRGNLPGVRAVVRRLDADERTVQDAVPVTTLHRTLADLADTDRPQAKETIGEALRSGRISSRAWRRAIRRYTSLQCLHLDDSEPR